MNQKAESKASRRQFLASSAGFLVLKPATVFGTQANSTIQLGLIGCGSRGNWIGAFFHEYTLSRFTALHDPFETQLEYTKNNLKIPEAKTFGGLEGYKELLATDIDAVVIESPPYFHPEQALAAVEAGKHVFLAKPVAVDVPGCRTILEAGRKAQDRLSFLVDFQTRAQPVFQEAAQRVHRGDIGEPVLGHVYYHTGRLRPKPTEGLTADQARLRNWVFDRVLSGDIIVEQNIHVLDVANWYLQGNPIAAFGTGGRKARTDVGDAWDHFVVAYYYPDEVKVDFSSAQFTRGFHDMCIRIYGSKGTVDSHYGGLVRITGDNPWHGTDKDDTFREGAIRNVKAFIESIQTGKYLNNARESVYSNLTCILGREAAYRRRIVTWEDVINSNEKLEAKLNI